MNTIYHNNKFCFSFELIFPSTSFTLKFSGQSHCDTSGSEQNLNQVDTFRGDRRLEGNLIKSILWYRYYMLFFRAVTDNSLIPRSIYVTFSPFLFFSPTLYDKWTKTNARDIECALHFGDNHNKIFSYNLFAVKLARTIIDVFTPPISGVKT